MKGTEPKNTQPAWEFYDLEKDPNELHNAYKDSEYQGLISEMKNELMKLREDIGDTDKQYPEMVRIFEEYWNQ